VTEFRFDHATADDDAAIRRLLAINPVPGPVTLTYEREPSYFLGCGTLGRFCQVLVARHRPSGEVVGIASRATRPLFVNGRVEEVGYLSQLRVDRRFRGRWLVSRGFHFLKQLDADGLVDGYLTSIPDENVVARGMLLDLRRDHFPVLREVDVLYTLALVLRAPKVAPQSPYEICRGSWMDLGAIVAFLRRHGPAKQFFPAYAEDNFGASSLTLGFRVEDFILARRHGEVVGVVGLWDQSSYKQTVVRGYSGMLRWARPCHNVAAGLLGAQPLPPLGGHIRSAYASFICTVNNDPDIFRVLLRHVYNLAAERQYAYLMVGLTARDPLLAVARRYWHIAYRSGLYTVCWEDGSDLHERLDRRVPYVEIASL
jgi:hypothetical protein